MIAKSLACVLFLYLFLGASVFAQDEDMESKMDYKVNKMQKELNLTESQAQAIRPIVKDYLIKHEAILQDTSGEGIVDHVALKTTLKALRENEYKNLSKVLTPDQLKEWIDKDNVMLVLNPDSPESSVDDGASLNGDGVNLKF